MLDLLRLLDYWLFTQINNNWTQSYADIFFIWVTDLHKTAYFKIILVPFVIFLFVKNFRLKGITLFIFLLLALSTSDFFGAIVKSEITRERPFNNTELNVVKRSDAGHYSFYSNHASNMFTFATYTAQFVPGLKIPFFAIAALVAYSRVYNGVHYPSDVLTGALMGILWGLLFTFIVKKIMNLIENRKSLS